MESALRLFFGRDDLTILTRPEWGSTNLGYRRQIRDALREFTGENHSDLEKPPISTEYSISISHSHTAGGFAAVRKPLFVGFDIEETARIQASVVARVSSTDEVVTAPSSAALWSAKEAAFKALTSLGHWKVLGDVSICDWARVSIDGIDAASTFKVSTPKTAFANGQGLVFSRDTLTIGLFLAEF